MAKLIKSIFNYFKEVKSEVKKISWPSKAKIKDNTQVVVVFSAVFGAIVFGMDYTVNEFIKFLIR